MSNVGKTGQSRGFSLFDLTSDEIQHELLDVGFSPARLTPLEIQLLAKFLLLGF
mgnify:CR=1 FL=1